MAMPTMSILEIFAPKGPAHWECNSNKGEEQCGKMNSSAYKQAKCKLGQNLIT
jgi:hypothetical protein